MDVYGRQPHYYLDNQNEACLRQLRDESTTNGIRKIKSRYYGQASTTQPLTNVIKSTMSKSHIRELISEGDINALEDLVFQGQGDRLLGETSNISKVQSFLNLVPMYMERIYDVHRAVMRDQLEHVVILLQNRKLALARDQLGATPLHKAVWFGHYKIAHYISHQFSETVNAVDMEGRTALHYAASIKDNKNMYGILIEAGSNKGCYDNKGKTADYYSQYPEHLNLEEVIKRCHKVNANYLANTTNRIKSKSPNRQSPPPSNGSLSSPRTDENDGSSKENSHCNDSGNENEHLMILQNDKFSKRFDVTSANLRKWAAEKDMERLTQAIVEGYGDKVVQSVDTEDAEKFVEMVERVKAIHQAVSSDDLKELQNHLDQKDLALAKDHMGMTPLHKAVLLRKTKVVHFLVDKFPEAINAKNKNGLTALHFAAALSRKDGQQLHKILLNAGADAKIRDKHGRMADYYKTHLITLPTKGMMKTRPVGGRGPEWNRYSKQGVLEKMTIALQRGDIELVEDLVLDGHGKHLLGKATWHEDVKTFLKDLPSYLNTIQSFHEAVQKGDVHRVGEEVSRNEKLIRARDEKGSAPFHLAAAVESTDLLNYLIQNFPNHINSKDSMGRTALHIVCRKGNLDLCEMLKKAGADAKILDIKGKTAEFYLHNNPKQEGSVTRQNLNASKEPVSKNSESMYSNSSREDVLKISANGMKKDYSNRKKRFGKQQTVSITSTSQTISEDNTSPSSETVSVSTDKNNNNEDTSPTTPADEEEGLSSRENIEDADHFRMNEVIEENNDKNETHDPLTDSVNDEEKITENLNETESLDESECKENVEHETAEDVVEASSDNENKGEEHDVNENEAVDEVEQQSESDAELLEGEGNDAVVEANEESIESGCCTTEAEDNTTDVKSESNENQDGENTQELLDPEDVSDVTEKAPDECEDAPLLEESVPPSSRQAEESANQCVESTDSEEILINEEEHHEQSSEDTGALTNIQSIVEKMVAEVGSGNVIDNVDTIKELVSDADNESSECPTNNIDCEDVTQTNEPNLLEWDINIESDEIEKEDDVACINEPISENYEENENIEEVESETCPMPELNEENSHEEEKNDIDEKQSEDAEEQTEIAGDIQTDTTDENTNINGNGEQHDNETDIPKEDAATLIECNEANPDGIENEDNQDTIEQDGQSHKINDESNENPETKRDDDEKPEIMEENDEHEEIKQQDKECQEIPEENAEHYEMNEQNGEDHEIKEQSEEYEEMKEPEEENQETGTSKEATEENDSNQETKELNEDNQDSIEQNDCNVEDEGNQYTIHENEINPDKHDENLPDSLIDTGTPNSSSTHQKKDHLDELIELWIKEGDLLRLEHVVLAGQGDRLIERTSEDKQVQDFLDLVPIYMAKIRAVHEAVAKGLLREVRSVLTRKRFALSRDHVGASPLHLAVLHGHTDVTTYIISHFPETMDGPDNEGRTPLHYASALHDDGALYKLLKAAGAEENIEDKAGHSPKYYMSNPGILTLTQLLEPYSLTE